MPTAGRPPAGPRAPWRPALTLGAAVLGAALAGLATFAWPSNPGVHLSVAERAGAAQGVALAGLAIGVLAGVVGRGRGAFAAVLLPLAALGLAATLPVTGRAVVHVAPTWLVLAAAAVLAALALLRSALAELVPWALGACALGAAALSWRGAPDRPAPLPLAAQPPVFLLTLDTVRADVFDFIEPDGLEGLGAAATPHLRALAAGARVFSRAYAPAALTGPTHASLFSGHTPWEHGVWDNGEPLPTRGPDGGPLPWLPSWFAAHGYETVGVVSVGVLGHRAGFSRGFDVYDSVFAERLAVGHPLLRALGHRPVDPDHFSRPGRATVDVLRAIPKAHGPRLTWVHLFDAHWPYTPGAEARARWGLGVDEVVQTADLMRAHGPGRPMDPAVVERGRRLYLAEIEELDAIIGELLAEIPEDAVLVIVGDHGESLGEQGLHFSHGVLASGASTRVPLLVRAPGLTPGVERRTVSTVDLLPTLLALVGAPLPGRRTWLAPEGPVWSAAARSAGGEAEACPSAGALAPAPLARGAQPLGGLLAVARRDDDLHVVASCWEPVGQASAVGDPLELQLWPAPAGISPSALPKPPGLAPAPGLETRAMLEALGYLSPGP